MKTIPTFNLQTRLDIARVAKGDFAFHARDKSMVHRDDNYILLFQETGETRIMVDFQDITISGAAAFCILPGQVHFGTLAEDVSAWVLAVNADWIPSSLRLAFMETAIRKQPVIINDKHELLFTNALTLLHALDEHIDDIPEQALRSMLDVCLNLFVATFQHDLSYSGKANSRPALIIRQFRTLLLDNFRVLKSPSEYAAAMNITPAYLNEVVKESTGQPVSHWIHQEIILEAKRILYYTNNTVKEIAWSLGYSDPAYFIRLFKKVAGVPPLTFRDKYHV